MDCETRTQLPLMLMHLKPGNSNSQVNLRVTCVLSTGMQSNSFNSHTSVMWWLWNAFKFYSSFCLLFVYVTVHVLNFNSASQNPVVTNSGKIWTQFRKHSGTSDSCSRCEQSPASHTHMFWTVFGAVLSPERLTALFGVSWISIPNLPRAQWSVLAFTTLLARCLIFFKWKHSSLSSHNSWLKETLDYIKLENSRFPLRVNSRSLRGPGAPLQNMFMFNLLAIIIKIHLSNFVYLTF